MFEDTKVVHTDQPEENQFMVYVEFVYNKKKELKDIVANLVGQIYNYISIYERLTKQQVKKDLSLVLYKEANNIIFLSVDFTKKETKIIFITNEGKTNQLLIEFDHADIQNNNIQNIFIINMRDIIIHIQNKIKIENMLVQALRQNIL